VLLLKDKLSKKMDLPLKAIMVKHIIITNFRTWR